MVYCDIPGWEDTRGFPNNMANSIWLARLFQAAKKVSMVIVVDYPSLKTARGDVIKGLMDTIQNMLP